MDDVEPEVSETELFPERVGDRLRAARIKSGLDLNDVATRTRVPLRHLQAIETNDYSNMPSPTYCVGFAKSYARAVNEDETSIGRDLREELGVTSGPSVTHMDFDAADPARVPPKWLAWGAIGAIVLVGGGYAFLKGWHSDPSSQSQVEASNVMLPGDPNAVAANGVGGQAVPTSGPVVLVITGDVWMRLYDKNQKVFFEGVKKKGENVPIPADIDTPMIRTRLLQNISLTVAGKSVPPLGDHEELVKDQVLTAAALAARKASEPPKPTVSASQAGTATPR